MQVRLDGIHHVKRKLADGTIRHHYYAWRGGPAIKAAPHTPAFAFEFARHHEDARKVPTLTLADLVDQFTGPERARNVDFLRMAETTQRDHLYAFGIIKAEWPRLPVKFTQDGKFKGIIKAWHRSFAANPRKADKLLFSLSKVFSYAIDSGIIDKNPVTGIGRLYSGSRRESVWSAAQIATMRANAPAHLLLPFEIAIMTGQRQGDILALSWKSYDGVHIAVEQSKGKKRLRVKVHARLKAMLDALPKDTLRICTNSRSRPWTKDGFKTSWGKLCDALRIKGVTFHDLRGTFITARAKEGSSVEDIARISGHSTSEVKSVLEKHYLADDQDASDAVIISMEKRLQEL